jgi:hypothetical protein
MGREITHSPTTTSDGRVGGRWVSGCRNVLSLSLSLSGVPVGGATSDGSERRVGWKDPPTRDETTTIF